MNRLILTAVTALTLTTPGLARASGWNESTTDDGVYAEYADPVGGCAYRHRKDPSIDPKTCFVGFYTLDLKHRHRVHLPDYNNKTGEPLPTNLRGLEIKRERVMNVSHFWGPSGNYDPGPKHCPDPIDERCQPGEVTTGIR